MSRHNPSTSSGSTMSSKSKPKKFCTRGEEFFDFLKSLGYQPSKHQQAEHFEYLFQDDKSASFVRKLMSTLKSDNCLLPEDIQRYEDLKKEEMVLYGSDLEEAISRRRAIDEMFSQQKLKRLVKKQELEKLLKEKGAELERLSKLRDGVFMNAVGEWEIKQTKVDCVLGIIQRFNEEYEKEIETDLKFLNEKMEDLEKTVVQLKRDLKPGQAQDDIQYLCQIDVATLVEKEDKLFERVQNMITKHGTELIMKDAGYAVEGDPLNEENIRKIFCQFEKDFNRLKHCIVYERIDQLNLELSLAGCVENFEDCHKRATQLALTDYDTRAKLQMETRDNTNDLTIAFERESEELLERVRQLAAAAVNQQFSAITDIKARAKKKLQEFFALTTRVLKTQKIRLSLIRNLVKSEGKIYGRLVSNIEENIAASTAHSKKLASNSVAISGLSQEGEILKYFMSLFGIAHPYEAITSLPKLHLIVGKCLSELESSYWSSINETKTQSQNLKKHLDKKYGVLKNVLNSANESPKEGFKAKSSEKEDFIKQQKLILTNLQQTRAGMSKEQHKSRVQSNRKLNDILEGY